MKTHKSNAELKKALNYDLSNTKNLLKMITIKLIVFCERQLPGSHHEYPIYIDYDLHRQPLQTRNVGYFEVYIKVIKQNNCSLKNSPSFSDVMNWQAIALGRMGKSWKSFSVSLVWQTNSFSTQYFLAFEYSRLPAYLRFSMVKSRTIPLLQAQAISMWDTDNAKPLLTWKLSSENGEAIKR